MAAVGQEADSSSVSSAEPSEGAFLANILAPGSTLHPTFLLIVDVCFVFLVLVLLALLVATRSVHFVALTLVALGLWASVKW
jgi:hypothetical protein